MMTAKFRLLALIVVALTSIQSAHQQLSPQQPIGLQGVPGGASGSGVIPPGQQVAGVLPQNIYAFLKSNQATNRFASILDQLSQQYNDPTLINILSSDNPSANSATLGSNGFTVFAPVNEALNNLPNNPDSFRNGIYNLVVRDKITLEMLRTLNGQNISRTFGYWPKLNVRVVKSFFLNQLAKMKNPGNMGGSMGDYRAGNTYQQNNQYPSGPVNNNNNYQQNWGNTNNNMNNNYQQQQGMNPQYPPRNVDNNNTGINENMRHEGASHKVPRQIYPNQQFPASTPYPPSWTGSGTPPPNWDPNAQYPQGQGNNQYPSNMNHNQYPPQGAAADLTGHHQGPYGDPNSNLNVYDQYASMYGSQQIAGLPASPRIPLDEIFLINNAIILDKFELTNGIVYIISSYPRYYEKSILQLLTNNDINGLATNLNFWITRAAQSFRMGDENLKNALNAFGPNTYFLPTDQAFNKFNDRDRLNNNSFLFDLFRAHRINDRMLFSYYFDDPSVVAYTDTGLPVSSRHVRVNGQDEIEISIGHVKGRLLTEYSNIYCASGVVHLVDTVLGVPARNAYQELSTIPELSQFKQLVDRSPRFRQLLDQQNTMIGQYPSRPVYGQQRLQRQPTTPSFNDQTQTNETGPAQPVPTSTPAIQKRARRQDTMNSNLNAQVPILNPTPNVGPLGVMGTNSLLNPQNDPNNYLTQNMNQALPNNQVNYNQPQNMANGYYPYSQSNVQQYTILAPTNTAFLGITDDILSNATAIEALISAHIIVDNGNRAFYTDHDDSIFQNGQIYSTLNPGVPLVASVTPEMSSAGNRVSLQIQNTPNVVTTITNGNDRVSNGVIHIVDKIISQFASTDIATLLERYAQSNSPGAPAFSQFVDALRITGIFNDLRQPTRKYTLFIPTNEALAQYQDILMSTDIDKKRQLIYRHICLDQNLQSTYLSAVANGNNWSPSYNQQGQVNPAINQQSPIGPATNPSFSPQSLGGSYSPPVLPNNPPYNQNNPQFNSGYYNQGNQLICRNALGQDLTLSKDSQGLVSKYQGQASAKVITDFPGIYSSAYLLEKPLLNQNLPNYGLNYVNSAPSLVQFNLILSILVILAALVTMN